MKLKVVIYLENKSRYRDLVNSVVYMIVRSLQFCENTKLRLAFHNFLHYLEVETIVKSKAQSAVLCTGNAKNPALYFVSETLSSYHFFRSSYLDDDRNQTLCIWQITSFPWHHTDLVGSL